MIRRVLLVSAFMFIFFTPIVKAADSDTRCGESRYWWQSRYLETTTKLKEVEEYYDEAVASYHRNYPKVRFTEAEEREFKKIESNMEKWADAVKKWGELKRELRKFADKCDVPSEWRK